MVFPRERFSEFPSRLLLFFSHCIWGCFLAFIVKNEKSEENELFGISIETIDCDYEGQPPVEKKWTIVAARVDLASLAKVQYD